MRQNEIQSKVDHYKNLRTQVMSQIAATGYSKRSIQDAVMRAYDNAKAHLPADMTLTSVDIVESADDDGYYAMASVKYERYARSLHTEVR